MIGTAVWAPSVHNTQPWRFAVRPGEISLYADPDRRLAVADPAGREMLISCGAALFNVRLALRYLGWVPETISDARPGPADAGGPDRLVTADPARGLRVRPVPAGGRAGGRTAAGSTPVTCPPRLLAALGHGAARHGATLQLITDGGPKAALSAVVDAAEGLLRLDAARSQELARWASPPGSSRPDGVPATAYPAVPDVTDLAFPGRDFAQGRGWGTAPARSAPLMRPAGHARLADHAR